MGGLDALRCRLQNLPYEQTSGERFRNSRVRVSQVSLPETKVLFVQNSPLLLCRLLFFSHLNFILRHLKAATVSTMNSELLDYPRQHIWSLSQYGPPGMQWEDETTNMSSVLEDNGQTDRLCSKMCAATCNTFRC